MNYFRYFKFTAHNLKTQLMTLVASEQVNSQERHKLIAILLMEQLNHMEVYTMSKQRKTVFYGAISLDGYLARKNHSLDWLIGTEGENDTSYPEFYETVDTLIMGRKTYEQILLLSPEEFPYKGKKCYVFSRTLTGSTEFVTFVNSDLADFVKSLTSQTGKRIWIVGGGEVLKPLLEEKLVDEFIIQLTPVIIGNGIPLFVPGDYENKLLLKDVKQYHQFVEVHYEQTE